MSDVTLHGTVFVPGQEDILQAQAIPLSDGQVAVDILTDENKDAAIALADVLIPQIDEAIETARDAVIAEFHALWNETWRQDEPELDRAAFRARLDVETVRVNAEYFEIWFADRDLFLGHALLAVFMPFSGTEIARGNFGTCSAEMFG